MPAVGIPRRDFLRGSLVAAASLHLPRVAAGEDAACDEPIAPEALCPVAPLGKRDEFFAPHAKFRELQLGSVRPEGWLHVELGKQANAELDEQARGLTCHQADFCFPFDRRYWASNERGQDQESRNGGTFWYPWEQVGYWTDGAYRCAKLVDNSHLHRRAMQPIRYTLDHPVDGWFLGPHKLYNLPPNQDPSRWPQAVFFRALCGAAEGENDAGILKAMCRHYLRDAACDYQHGPFGPRDLANIESILWCYAHSGDSRLFDMARDIWSNIPSSELLELTADVPSTMHGVTFAELSRLGAAMFLYTGDPGQLDVSVAAMQRIFKYHMLADGTPSASESLSGTTSLDGHETCDIVEFNLTWGYLLMATGEGGYADRIERALFNAGMGAIRKDWSGLQYISCPNQLHIARNSCQVGQHLGTAAALYGPNSDLRPKCDFVTACCAGNVSRMIPTYVQRTWMRSADGGLAAVLFGPCRVAATVGENGQAVEIVEETEYPFSERVMFHICSGEPIDFPLHLRIPHWCENPRLSINCRVRELPEVHDGFLTLRRIHSPGDLISLELPMRVSSGRSSDGGIFLEHGPLVYSLRPQETWTPIAMPKFEITSPDYYPMWAAEARSSWNYALAINDHDPLDRQVALVRSVSCQDLWSSPPAALQAPARRVPGWHLLRPGGDNPKWFMTPSLPEDRSPAGPTETIALVPLGSTHLRLSIFPTSPGRAIP